MPEDNAITTGAKGLVSRLGNKVGPLPAWAWAAIPAGAYVIWSYYRASTSGDYVDEGVVSDETSDEYINTGGYPSISGGYSGAPNGSSNLPSIPTPDYTNNDWARDAIKWLTSQGVNSLTATNAVNAYILGYPTTLNTSERKALSDVIAAKGPAPHGGTVPPLTPTPTPTPTPKPSPVTKLQPVGKVSASGGKGTITISWVPPSTGPVPARYRWQINRAITSIFAGYTTATQHRQAGLKSGIYSVFVWSIDRDGKPSSSKSATVNVS